MRRVHILLYNEVDTLDFAALTAVLSTASAHHQHRLFEIQTVAKDTHTLLSESGLPLKPDLSYSEAEGADVLIIPGGAGSHAAMQDTQLVNWLRDQSYAAEKVLSIGSGARLLAAAGLLDGLGVTSDHATLDILPDYAPGVICLNTLRFTDNGQVLTSAGNAVGLDVALYLLSELCGVELALNTAQRLAYDWRMRGPG